MNEYDKLPAETWKAKIEVHGADNLEGIAGVDNQIAIQVFAMLDREMDRIAMNPALEHIASEIIADAVIKGLQKVIDMGPKANIISALNEYRTRQNQNREDNPISSA